MSLLRPMVRVLPNNDNLDASERGEIRPGIDVLCCGGSQSGESAMFAPIRTCWVDFQVLCRILDALDTLIP